MTADRMRGGFDTPASAGDEGGFVVGFPARRTADASALAEAQQTRPVGFTPAELIARIEEAFGGKDRAAPKHFTPADRDANPTEGWNPLDADAEPTPFIDPLEAAHQAGFEEGFAAARAESDAASARDRALLDALAAALRGAGGVDRGAMAARLRTTVLALVTRIVGDVGVSAELLAARVTAATDLLADASESAMLRVHPDDVPLLEGKLPATTFAVGDASITRGSFVMEAASTVVEDGPELWLEQLHGAIDRAALPSC